MEDILRCNGNHFWWSDAGQGSAGPETKPDSWAADRLSDLEGLLRESQGVVWGRLKVKSVQVCALCDPMDCSRARPPCPSPSWAFSSSCRSIQWCHPAPHPFVILAGGSQHHGSGLSLGLIKNPWWTWNRWCTLFTWPVPFTWVFRGLHTNAEISQVILCTASWEHWLWGHVVIDFRLHVLQSLEKWQGLLWLLPHPPPPRQNHAADGKLG